MVAQHRTPCSRCLHQTGAVIAEQGDVLQMANKPMHQRLLEHLNTAVVVLDSQLQMVWMNPAAETLLAVSLVRVKGSTPDNMTGLDDTLINVLRKALEEQHPYTQREAEIINAAHEALTVDFTATPISANELLVEIEPRDRLMQISREEALIARQEAVKVLTRGLAHEVKNPLGGIRGAAQLLERDLPEPQMVEFTRIIIEEVDRLRDLVDRMLGPNRPPLQAPVNVHAVTERVRALLQAEGSAITLSADYDPSLPEVIGDEGQLIQAVLNIARNATQALNEQPQPDSPQPDAAPYEITLRTRARRQFTLGHERHRLGCELAIIDNGPGIPESLRETLFYPMVSGRAEGSGLGLSIAQGILHQHQGLIECDSRPGHTEFRLLIPLAGTSGDHT